MDYNVELEKGQYRVSSVQLYPVYNLFLIDPSTISQEVFFFSSPSVLLRPIGSMSSLAASPQLLHSANPLQPFLCFVCSLRAGRTEGSRNPCNCKAGLGKNQSGLPNKHCPSRMAGLMFLLICLRKWDPLCPRGLQCRSFGH